ncbi:MAG: hypothetical protein K2W95_18000 [Candidatus Obscuribacterales bacterium]|nr:hypothetical protein [Candidatus Obscuribacterales bacterium]
MKNKFFAALLVGMVVLGAAAVAPAEAKAKHDRAANLAAMQMYAQQLAQQGQGPLAQQWGTPYNNQFGAYGAVNPYGAYNGYNPYGAVNPYSAVNPYGVNQFAGFANQFGAVNPYAAYDPYSGVNAYSDYGYGNGINNGFFGQNPYAQTGWRGQLSSILNGWF